LFLRPHLDAAEPALELPSPVSAAQAEPRLEDDSVEEPLVDEVEELGKELDGERRVDAATTKQCHGRGENL